MAKDVSRGYGTTVRMSSSYRIYIDWTGVEDEQHLILAAGTCRCCLASVQVLTLKEPQRMLRLDNSAQAFDYRICAPGEQLLQFEQELRNQA